MNTTSKPMIWIAYIKSLDCRRTIWQAEFRSEASAERALMAKYKELGYNPEEPACNSSIDCYDDDER